MTVNPIIDEKELPRWSVSAKRPAPKADTRLVFVDSARRVHAPEQPMTLSEVVWGGLRRMYEVDLREHDAEFRAQVPCAEKGFYFDVHFSFSWRVGDAAQIVRDGRTDVTSVYQRHLVEKVSEQSERYSLEDRLTAERTLKTMLSAELPLPEGIVIRNCVLTLSLGTEAEAHLKNRTLASFENETRELRHRANLDQAQRDQVELSATDEIAVLKGRLRADHQRRQLATEQELNARRNELELEAEQHRLELDRQRRLAEAATELQVAELQRRLELQQAAHRLELEEQSRRQELTIKAERMRFYQSALESGNVSSLIPIFLDEHPKDVGQLLNLMLAQHRENREHSRKVLQAMLEAGMVNGHDLDDTRRAALQNLLSGLTTGALGVGIEDGAAPAIETARETPDDDPDDDDDTDDDDSDD